MEGTLYQVNNNLNELTPIEVKYIRKTDSFYWTRKDWRCAINTNYYKSFETKEEAVAHLQYLIENKTRQSQSSLDYYNEKMAKFKELNNQ